MIGHHPVFGAISANGYNATALYGADASSTDLGRKDASGGASWASVRPGAAKGKGGRREEGSRGGERSSSKDG